MIGYRRRNLSAEVLLDIDAHVAACEPCRRSLRECESMANTGAILSGLGEPHLSYEAIESYVEGKAADAERRCIESHLEICRPCQEEADDLRQFRNQARAWPAAPRREPRSWRWGFPVLAAGFASLLIAVGVHWWWSAARHISPLLALNDGPARGIPAADWAAMERALGEGALEIPDSLSALRGGPTQVRGAATADRFALRSPLGTAVLSDQPPFTWQPLPGAAGYRVAVFGDGDRKVAESEWLDRTAWTPSEPLPRGHVYSWQVTARLGTAADAPTLLAPAVEDPQARFAVAGASDAAELERAARKYAGSHLLLGVLYARAGVLDLAEQEFAALARANPQSPQAAALLGRIRSTLRR